MLKGIKMRFGKIGTAFLVGGALVLGGIFFLNTAAAQTSGANCNSSTSGFWGHIYCTMTQLVGSPSQGISGADTLFKGQRAIYDRIGTSSGSTQTSGLGVYLEKAGTSIYYGKLATYVPNGSYVWDCPIIPGGPITDSNGDTHGISGGSVGGVCPQIPYGTHSRSNVTAVFIPIESVANSYSITRRGVNVKPTFCFLREEITSDNNTVSTQNQGLRNVEKIILQCSYVPNICQDTSSTTGIGRNGCLGYNDTRRTLHDYTVNPVSVTEQFRVIVK